MFIFSIIMVVFIVMIIFKNITTSYNHCYMKTVVDGSILITLAI